MSPQSNNEPTPNPEAPVPQPKLPPKVAKALRALKAQHQKYKRAQKSLDRKTATAWSKLEKVAAQLSKLRSQHEHLMRKGDQLGTINERDRQPLVLALHKACAGTDINVIDLIQSLNEHR